MGWKHLKFIIAAALGAALLCAAAPGFAGSSPVLNDFILKWQDDPKVNCKDGGGTTYEMNVCGGRDYQKAYKTLAALYNKLHAAYDGDNRKALQASQIAWERYMAAECDYETFLSRDGSMHSSMVTSCKLSRVAERIARLKAQETCEEGDMTCNHP